MNRILTGILCAFLLTSSAFAQRQYADTLYNPVIANSAYQPESGPSVYIHEGHYNFHTKDGRYKPFATLVSRDGYRVKSFSGEFNQDNLEPVDILVISNALHESNAENWDKANPSAFIKDEIQTLESWVKEGGSLFLLTDLMPMAGVTSELGKVFGYTFYNGFATDTTKTGSDLFIRHGMQRT